MAYRGKINEKLRPRQIRLGGSLDNSRKSCNFAMNQ